MPKIKTITFDLDDTLWQVKPTLIRAEQLTFDWLLANAPLINGAFDLPALMQWRMQVHNERPELAHQISESRRVAITEALMSVGYATAEAKALSDQAFALFLQARHEVSLFDEVEPLLQALKPHYQLGVLTNGNADIRKLPISHYFDFAYSAEQLNASKPAPDLFHAALNSSQSLAHELVHIGDHLEHDVQGALDAGCHAIWLNLNNQILPRNEKPIVEVQSLNGILAAIRKIEGQSCKL